jgi:hypothetical protein
MGIPDEIEGVTPPPPTHTHTYPGSFVPVLQKCPELGGSVYNMIFWKFEILLGFFLIIVGLVKNNGR